MRKRECVVATTHMKYFRYWLLWLLCGALGWGTLLPGCASGPQVLTIPIVSESVKPPSYGSKDYGSALAAIMSVMVRDLKLPPIDGGSVTIYPSQASFEAGVVAQSAERLEQLRKQLGPRAKQATEAESVLAATTLAVGSNAVGMYKRVLINEWRVAKYSLAGVGTAFSARVDPYRAARAGRWSAHCAPSMAHRGICRMGRIQGRGYLPCPGICLQS